ncbi:MAG: DUF6339 family protein [Rhodobacter sp.]|nr:DUF6339 family protein [Rhodobacter sp.]MCY4243564.1 DUF6339 family protein [Rhodobacter sp.]
MIQHDHLRYLSEEKLEELRRKVGLHRERYANGDFRDLEPDNGWAIETGGVTVDRDLLAGLDGIARTAAGDRTASAVLYRALSGMTPALAREERVWVRLSHVECLGYARSRWLSGLDGERLVPQVRRHLFGSGLTGIRDDNALSRLWWNIHIAATADPDDPEGALDLILKTADIRSNFVERTNTAARPPLARAVIRAMRRNSWITSTERAFREFMIVLNRDGGGILFETMSDAEVDGIMNACAERARARSEQRAIQERASEGPGSRGLGWVRGIFGGHRPQPTSEEKR